MLKDRKIIDWTQPVSSLADRPQMTAAALKAAFDSNTNQVKPALNGVIDDLTGTDGATNIGTSQIDGVTGTDVQAMLAFLKGLIDLREPTENVNQKLALKADKAVTDKHVKTVSFDGKTGVFTFISEDGTSQTLDTMLEKVPVRCYLDGQTFVLVLEDGTEQRADLSAFLTETEFVDSETIDFVILDGSVRASVKAGSITLDMLESTVVSTLQGYMTAAQTAAENAKASETNAAAHRDAAAASETAAAQSASESRGQATAAKSWAVGGTATRPGEDTDNAKYYAERSGESANTAQGWADTAMVHKDAAENSAIRAEQAAKDAEAIVGGDFIPNSQKGVPNGVASLNAQGKLKTEQKPVYTADEIGAVPQTRTINKKPLSADVTLTGEDIPAGAEDEKTLSSHLAECKKRLKDAVHADYTHITTLDDLVRYRNVFTCVAPPATGMPYLDYWNCIVWADSRESTEQHYTRVIYASPANKNELWKLNLTNGAKSEWVCIATATPPEEIPLNLAAGITHHNPETKSTISRSQEGLVVVHFFCKKVDGNDMGSGEVLATLPEGFRPSTNVHIPASVSLDGTTFTDTALVVAGSNGYIWLAYPPAGCKAVTATLVFYAGQ